MADVVYRGLEIKFKDAKMDFTNSVIDSAKSEHENSLVVQQMGLLKSETSKLNEIFDKQWNQMLHFIATDMPVDQFSTYFIKQKSLEMDK